MMTMVKKGGGDNMNFAKTCVAVLVGVLIGAELHHLQPVHAAGSPVYVKQTHMGANYDPLLEGRNVVGFSCTPDGSCYIAAQ